MVVQFQGSKPVESKRIIHLVMRFNSVQSTFISVTCHELGYNSMATARPINMRLGLRAAGCIRTQHSPQLGFTTIQHSPHSNIRQHPYRGRQNSADIPKMISPGVVPFCSGTYATWRPARKAELDFKRQTARYRTIIPYQW
jgi:hypothetical protein